MYLYNNNADAKSFPRSTKLNIQYENDIFLAIYALKIYILI